MTAFTVSYGTPGGIGAGQPFLNFFSLAPTVVTDTAPVTKYMPKNGPANIASGSLNNNNNIVKNYVGKSGTMQNLYVGYSVASTADITFTVQVNGSDTAMTCTVLAGGTAAHDTSNSVIVNVGDAITIKYVVSILDNTNRLISASIVII